MRKWLEWTPVGSLYALGDWMQALGHPVGRMGALIGLVAGAAYLAVAPGRVAEPVVTLLAAALMGTVWWVLVLLGRANGYGQWMLAASAFTTPLFLLTMPGKGAAIHFQAVVGGVVFGTLSGAFVPLGLKRLSYRLRPLGAGQKFALALAAPHAHLLDDGGTTLLAGEEPSVARELLAEAWNVKDPVTLRDTLEWLLDEGHQAQLEQARTAAVRSVFVVSHEAALARGIRAWDWGRAVQVVRWAVSAGYLSDAEAWEWLDDVAERTSRAYGSWEEFAAQYALGAAFWHQLGNEGDETAFAGATRWALKKRWSRLSWPGAAE
jgi:hypothetical protein